MISSSFTNVSFILPSYFMTYITVVNPKGFHREYSSNLHVHLQMHVLWTVRLPSTMWLPYEDSG